MTTNLTIYQKKYHYRKTKQGSSIPFQHNEKRGVKCTTFTEVTKCNSLSVNVKYNAKGSKVVTVLETADRGFIGATGHIFKVSNNRL